MTGKLQPATRNAILASRPPRSTIDAFGVEVTVQGLDLNAVIVLNEFLSEKGEPRPGRHAWAAYAAFGIIDPETGERMFTLEEVEALGATDKGSLERVYEEVARLSGYRRGADVPLDPPADSPTGSA